MASAFAIVANESMAQSRMGRQHSSANRRSRYLSDFIIIGVLHFHVFFGHGRIIFKP
jgi:hypothetical protein